MIDMLYKYMYCTVQSSWRRGLVVFDDMMKMKLLYIQFRKKKKKSLFFSLLQDEVPSIYVFYLIWTHELSFKKFVFFFLFS